MNEPIWIDEADALGIHDRLLADLALADRALADPPPALGGSGGVRDASALRSALARPLQHRADASGPDIIDLAAAYSADIVRHRPFTHGNELTGFVIAILFLELNGYRFKASEADAAQAMLELAGGTLEEAQFSAFLRAHAKIAWAQFGAGGNATSRTT
jgi:death-on-curing protein